MDLENSKPDTTSGPPIPSTTPTSEDAQKNFLKHKENYEQLRADVSVKMQFLDENRVILKISVFFSLVR